jgi:hypothetical protein
MKYMDWAAMGMASGAYACDEKAITYLMGNLSIE